MSNGPRYEGLISRLGGNEDQKLGNGISKKGDKKLPPIFLINFSDSKLNVNHELAIKHDLTHKDSTKLWSFEVECPKTAKSMIIP